MFRSNMTQICTASSCNSNNKEEFNGGLICFAFPADEETCKSWILRSRRYDLLGKSPAELRVTERLCQLHFEDHCFINTEAGLLLKAGAKPTIFNHDLSQFAREIEKEKHSGSFDSADIGTVHYKPSDNNVSVITFQVEMDKQDEEQEQQRDNFNSVISANGMHSLGNRIYLEPGLIIQRNNQSQVAVSDYLKTVEQLDSLTEPVNVIIEDIDNTQNWNIHEDADLSVPVVETVNPDLLCRVCAEESRDLVCVFSTEGLDMELPQKISWHLPIKVNENDKLPLKMCALCITKLNCCHDLVNCCLEADAKLKRIFNLLEMRSEEFQDGSVQDTFINHNDSNQHILPHITDEDITEVSSHCWKKQEEATVIPQEEHVNVHSNNQVSSAVKLPGMDNIIVMSNRNIQLREVDNRLQLAANGLSANETEIEPIHNFREIESHLPDVQEPALPDLQESALSDIRQSSLPDMRVPAVPDIEESVPESCNAVIKDKNEDRSTSNKERDICEVVNICIESAVENIKRDKSVICKEVKNNIKNTVVKVKSENSEVSQDILNDSNKIVSDNKETTPSRILSSNRGRNPKDWVCDICHCVAPKKVSLIRHQRSKHASRNFQCDKCMKRFRDMFMLKTHKKTHSETKPDSFICATCDSTFSTKRTLQEHVIANHSASKKYECQKCHKCYGSSASLDIHVATHSNETPFLCDLCGKSFKHVSNLRSHKRSHLDEADKNRQICEICKKGFRSRFHLSEHMNVHENKKPYQCEICGKHFHKKIQLRQHSSAHLSVQPYSCPICGVKFNRRGNMTQHLKRHGEERKFVCKICDQQFPTLGSTLSHRKTHTQAEVELSIKKHGTPESSILKCNICGKLLAKKETLMAHMRSHAGEKIFECTECGKRLSNKGSLLYHMRSFHTQDRPYPCQFCGEGFLSKDACLVHERIHTGEKPYKCTVCDMAFRCKSNLAQHSRVHSKARPFECPDCGKCFQRKGALDVHRRTHTGERPFPCDVCDRRFTQKNDMLKHKKTHMSRNVTAKSLQCDQCGRTLANRREVAKHKLLHETFKDVEEMCDPITELKVENTCIQTSFHCGQCGETLTDKHDLDKHQLLHMTFEDIAEQPIESSTKSVFSSGISVIGKLYHCTQCGETLADKHELAKHQLLHMTFEDIEDTATESVPQTVLITTDNLITHYSELETAEVLENTHTLILQRY